MSSCDKENNPIEETSTLNGRTFVYTQTLNYSETTTTLKFEKTFCTINLSGYEYELRNNVYIKKCINNQARNCLYSFSGDKVTLRKYPLDSPFNANGGDVTLTYSHLGVGMRHALVYGKFREIIFTEK